MTPLKTEAATARNPGRASVPRTLAVIAAEQRLESARISILLAIIVYGAVGAMLDWWPIDWLNLVQHRVGGSYSSKLSAIVFIAVASLGQALLWNAIVDFVTRQIAAREGSAGTISAPYAPSLAPGRPLTQSQLLVRMAFGTVLAIWVAAAAVFFWFDARQRSDNAADYATLGLEPSAPLHLSLGDHMSVQGLVLASRVVTFMSDSRSERPAYFLVPVVPQGWRAGEAVRVLLRVDSPSALPGFRPAAARVPWMLPERVLGRVQGNAPLIARTEFERMGVVLTPDNQVLEVIASQGGKPVPLAVDYLERVLWGAGLGSVFVLLMFGGAFFIVRRR
jgi:hypothetical protein